MRADALRCLRLLVQAVGDGDALAFFVPGLASGLGAALISAGKHPAASCLHSCRLVPQLPALPARPLAGLMAVGRASWLPRTPGKSPSCRAAGVGQGTRNRSGPAAHSAAAAEAVAAMVAVLRLALSDSQAALLPGAPGGAAADASSARAALQRLELRPADAEPLELTAAESERAGIVRMAFQCMLRSSIMTAGGTFSAGPWQS